MFAVQISACTDCGNNFPGYASKKQFNVEPCKAQIYTPSQQTREVLSMRVRARSLLLSEKHDEQDSARARASSKVSRVACRFLCMWRLGGRGVSRVENICRPLSTVQEVSLISRTECVQGQSARSSAASSQTGTYSAISSERSAQGGGHIHAESCSTRSRQSTNPENARLR